MAPSATKEYLPHGAWLTVGGFAPLLAWGTFPLLTAPVEALVFHGAFAVSLLLLSAAALLGRGGPFERPGVVRACAAVMAAAPVALAVGLSSQVAFTVLVCGAAFSSAVCSMRWFAAVCSLERGQAVRCVLFSFAGCALFRVAVCPFFSLCPAPFCLVVAAAAPLSCELLLRGESACPRPPSPRDAFSSLRLLLILCVGLFVCGLVLGFARSALRPYSPGLASLVLSHGTTCAVLFALCEFARRPRLRRPAVARSVMAAGLFALLLVVCFDNRLGEALYAVMGCASLVVVALADMALLVLVVRHDMEPLFVFGVGRAAFDLAIVAGSLSYGPVAAALPGVSATRALLFVVGCTLLLVFNGVVSLAESLALGPGIPHDGVEEDEERPAGRSSQALAERFELTDREAQVLSLLCAGLSRQEVALSLVISENTVHYHVKQIYKKLGVHSTAELLTVVFKE